MDVSLILKIAGIAMIVMVVCQVLSKNGRDDQAGYVSLAGMLIALYVLITKLGELIDVIEGVFGIV